MAGVPDAAMWEIDGAGNVQLNPNGVIVLGALDPIACEHYKLVGYNIDVNGLDTNGVVPPISPTPAVGAALNFCWCCGIDITAAAARPFDPVVFLWPPWSPYPLMIHRNCAYQQLSLNGQEAGMYVDRTSTKAFQAMKVNVLGAPANFPEAKIGQDISKAMGTYNLANPNQVGISANPGDEYAFENDLTVIPSILNTSQYRNDYSLVAPCRYSNVQIKRIQVREYVHPITGAHIRWGFSIAQSHAYLPSTLMIVRCEFPVGFFPGVAAPPPIFIVLNGGDLWSIGTPNPYGGGRQLNVLPADIMALATLNTTRNIFAGGGGGGGIPFTSMDMPQVVLAIRAHYIQRHMA